MGTVTSPAPPTTGPDPGAHLPDLSGRSGLATRLAVGVVAAVAWGVLVATWTPRGPQTTAEALWSLTLSLLVGLVAGVVSGSRWSLLAAPLAFVVAVELGRAGFEAPSVDRPVASTYGLVALVTGRGVHGVLALLPMTVGAAWGAGITRRLRAEGDPSFTGTLAPRRATAVAVLLVAALAVLVALPGRTAPITDAAGDEVEGSIAELTSVPVGGRDLGLLLRGHDSHAPVLLFLAGGPGGSELGAIAGHPLEEDFVVATLDQRGTGTSYDVLDPAATYTPDSAVLDVVGVSEHLRERFGQDRIYLVGQSWGSLLGVLAVQARPDLFHAFIGTGQMVSPAGTDRIFHADALAWARSRGDDALVERLEAIGAPPYEEILNYETALGYEHLVYPYDRSGNAEGAGGFSEHILAGEYTLLERVRNLGAFIDTFAALYPQLQGIDLRQDVPRLAVPVLLVEGAHEARGRSELSTEWLDRLEAPGKDRVLLDTSGHRGIFEQPAEFRAAVVAFTQP